MATRPKCLEILARCSDILITGKHIESVLAIFMLEPLIFSNFLIPNVNMKDIDFIICQTIHY